MFNVKLFQLLLQQNHKYHLCEKQNFTFGHHFMSHVTRKPVFGVCDQERLKPACSAIEDS